MTKSIKKLNLNRETLLPLTPDTLEGVNGGATPAFLISAAAISIEIASEIGCTWIQRKLGLDK